MSRSTKAGSNLVGSLVKRTRSLVAGYDEMLGPGEKILSHNKVTAVSYTHLTLPTILRV